jgi:hypothetical protein
MNSWWTQAVACLQVLIESAGCRAIADVERRNATVLSWRCKPLLPRRSRRRSDGEMPCLQQRAEARFGHDFHARATLVFGGIQATVGAYQQLLQRMTMAREDGNAG